MCKWNGIYTFPSTPVPMMSVGLLGCISKLMPWDSWDWSFLTYFVKCTTVFTVTIQFSDSDNFRYYDNIFFNYISRWIVLNSDFLLAVIIFEFRFYSPIINIDFYSKLSLTAKKRSLIKINENEVQKMKHIFEYSYRGCFIGENGTFWQPKNKNNEMHSN